jgi:UDP-N-acetylglucosamine--N-acetylmuramyl-(pentapeptide) pyrophosphoryl-undecaprenol N-acetylglucosamine transferase
MKILAVGGGSGGHVTPVVAVLKEIKRRHPRAKIRFWCDYSFYSQAKATAQSFDKHLRVDRIVAGKLRRYNQMSVIKQLTTPSIVLANFRDSFLVGAGVVQSLFKLIVWRPDVVFTKGGFVCLPVGFAAHLLRIPLVIHDSDAHPGLTNRILSKWATKIATGAPLEHYSYDPKKASYIGIPINEAFVPVTAKEQLRLKQKWNLDPELPLIVVTGGGLGAIRINNAVSRVLDDLLQIGSVVLVSGATQYDELVRTLPRRGRLQLYPFVTDMASLLGAADVVVTRAGATTILELAALAKPTILIPNAHLTGGHQLKNAAVYAAKDAALVLNEEAIEADPALLVTTVADVIADPKTSAERAKRLHEFSRPDAAADMASLILGARKL